MEWFTLAFKQYANFDGRAHRTAYWMFVLFYLIFYMVAIAIDGLLGMALVTGLYQLALFIPSISVGARRLHDTGRSGWWQLIGLIPILGIIVMIVFLVQDSQPGSNQYGPNPKL
jgi:uncharacterized membrane protein YhaH (DUF805 family)